MTTQATNRSPKRLYAAHIHASAHTPQVLMNSFFSMEGDKGTTMPTLEIIKATVRHGVRLRGVTEPSGTK